MSKRRKSQPTITSFFARPFSTTRSNESDAVTETTDAETATSIQESDAITPTETSTTCTPDSTESSTGIKTCKSKWLHEFRWAEFDNAKNKVFCADCKWGVNHNIAQADVDNYRYIKNAITTWVEVGWDNYNHGRSGMLRHANSKFHRESAFGRSVSRTNPVTSRIIDERTQSKLADNRTGLESIFHTILHISRQGQPLRGHTDDKSNFLNTMKLIGRFNEKVCSWLGRKELSKVAWLGHDCQNEILGDLSKSLLRDMVKEINEAKYFSIMADETMDITTKEQLSICFRFIDKNLNPREVFVGLIDCHKTNAETLHKLLENAMIALGLPIDNCRGQGFDGAAVMSGAVSGVQTRFRNEHPKMLFVHCAGHQINLAVSASLKCHADCESSLDELEATVRFIANSAKRLGSFEDFCKDSDCENDPRKIRPLCPTRWTMRLPALDVFLAKYESVLDFLKNTSENMEFNRETRSKANIRLRGLEKFNIFFVLHVIRSLLLYINPMHCMIQQRGLLLSKYRELLTSTINAIKEDFNNDAKVHAFVVAKFHEAAKIGLTEPEQPRVQSGRRTQNAEPRFETVEDYYKHNYKLIFSTAVETLTSRYQAQDIVTATHLENVLLQCSGNISEESFAESLSAVKTIYQDDIGENFDFEISQLRRYIIVKEYSVSSVDDLRILFTEYFPPFLNGWRKIFLAYLCLPCTTCECERSFSTLRRIKSYLRSTMSQSRLNHCMMLNIHSTSAGEYFFRNDEHELARIIDEWIDKSTVRCSTFLKLNK